MFYLEVRQRPLLLVIIMYLKNTKNNVTILLIVVNTILISISVASLTITNTFGWFLR